ncbi:MAG: class I SAM-dependent methyltransferase [Thermoleophilia bacterium]
MVGDALTATRLRALRGVLMMLDDLTSQTAQAIDDTREQARAQIEHAVSEQRTWIEAAMTGEARERERAQSDIQTLLRRIEGLERQLSDLQPGVRLARLERALRRSAPDPAAGPAPAPVADPAAPNPADPPLDYLAFEARFRGSEETVRARQEIYRDLLADRRRVVDIGCGRGELVGLLGEAGVSAYGVEMNEDFIEMGRAKGLEIVRGDVLGHLDSLEQGAVDAVVMSHVVEHLAPSVVSRAVSAIHDKLPDGGLLVMETPNPESLIAGSVNFHRDPTHLRPVHPETLAFICESAGFATTEILRLSPVPDEHRLPATSPGEGAMADHVDRIVERLNALLFGYQDYAVVARR